MKRYIFLSLAAILFLFASCEHTEIGDTDLNFSIETGNDELVSFIGMPALMKASLTKVDKENNYPFILKIEFSKGIIEFDGKEYENEEQTTNLDIDNPDKEIPIKFTPLEIGEHKITLIFKNELVTREKTFTVDCSKYLYTIRTENIPEKVFIDKEFNFDLIVDEAESTQSDSIFVYAKLMKGRGTLKYGNSQLNTDDDTKTRILIGRNQLTMLPHTDGENLLRFFVVNKWGHETSADATINVAYPTWNLKVEKDTLLIPLKEDFSFNLEVDEEDKTDETEYISFYRFASAVQNYALTINSNKVVQGKEFSLKSGVNVLSIKANEAGTGNLEFFVRDKYKQEKTLKLFFEIKLPVRPIEASLDNTSIQQYENEKATFKLNVSEKNYFETFTIKIEQLSGKGIFTTGKEMRVSAGTHDISYVPSETGTHTFKVTISDNNNQSMFLNATVQVEKNPLITLNHTVGGAVSGGGSFKYNTDVSAVAVPIAGYRFAGWYENGVKISDQAIFKFKALKNRTLEARFSKEKYTLTVSATAGGTAKGSGTFEYGVQASVVATPQTGYSFIGWYENGKDLISSAPTYNFSIEGNLKLEARFSKDKMTVTVNPTAGGKVEGGGVFDYGTYITLKATAETGYKFSGWYENGTQIGTALQHSLKVIKTKTIEARFTKLKYTLTVTSNPIAGGTVTGSGAYEYATQATIKATSNTGFSFIGWYEGDKLISSAPTVLFEVTKNTQLVAKFSRDKILLTVTATAGGTATGSGAYDYGTNASLKATAETGYQFSGWYEGDRQISASSLLSYKVEKATTIEARFSKQKFTISVSAGAGGTATGSGTFEYLTVTPITATPKTGYTFEGWYENGKQISVSQTYPIEVTRNMQVVAKFTRDKLTLTVNATAGGSATGSGAYEYGTNASLTATPQTGYKFEGWFENGSQIGTSLQLSYKVEKTTTIQARFTRQKYTLSLAVNPTNSGTITGGGVYEYSTQATIKATSNTGFSFIGWYEGDKLISSAPTVLFEVTKNTQLVAKFTRDKLTLTVNATAGGNATGSGAYEYGTQASLTATPQTGYKFEGWFENGSQIGTSLQLSYKVEKTTTIQAKFSKLKYTLSVSSTTGGTATGSGVFEYGTQATVKATAQSGYSFEGWYIGTSKVETSPLYLVDVTKNIQILAKFTRDKLNITVKATAGGTATGSGAYDYDTNVTLRATAETGYKFSGWFDNGSQIGTSLQLPYKVVKSTTIEARFMKEKYLVTVTPTAGGTATGGGSYEYNQQATLTAKTNTGYKFEGWFIGGSQKSMTNPYLYTVQSNAQIEARFSKLKYTLKLTAMSGGSVSGAGTFDYGTNASISATPQAGYKFIGWYENNTLINANANTNIQITKNRDLIAKFEKIKYTVYVTFRDAAYGSDITPKGTRSFNEFDGLELQASIKNDKAQKFLGWYDQNGRQLSTNLHFTLKKGQGITQVIGKFETKKYTIFITGGKAGDFNRNQLKNPYLYGSTPSFSVSHHDNWYRKNEGEEESKLCNRCESRTLLPIESNVTLRIEKGSR